MLRSDATRSAASHIDEAAPSRADLIAEAIRQAVVEQRLAPGTRLSEDQIGLLYGASRTIVRAALHRLAHDGLVTLARNRGASVAAPTVTDARHVFDARRAIEGPLVERAARRMSEAAAQRLTALIEKGRAAMAGADRGSAIRLSGDYHLAIADLADQPILRAFLTELVARSSLVIALYGTGRAADCRADEHDEVLAAIKAGDGAGAAALMRDHLAHIEADLDLRERITPALSLRDALQPTAPASRPVTPPTGW